MSRSKGNETMKFGQLIKYKQKYLSLKSCRKGGRETLAELFKSFFEWPWSTLRRL